MFDLADENGGPRLVRVDDVVRVARERLRVASLREASEPQRALEEAMRASAGWVAQEVASTREGAARAVYGINTGFGALAGLQAFAAPHLGPVLSRNLVVSHAAGTGRPLDEDVVRGATFIRACQLARGVSGVRPEVVNRLLGVLNADIYPVVPEAGSLGASGDLAPLAHLALVISRPPAGAPPDAGEGAVWEPIALDGRVDRSEPLHVGRDPATGEARLWRRGPAGPAMERAGGQVELAAKEGLALINGATMSAALLCLSVADAERLLAHAELAVAMTLEALRGFRDAFLPEVVAARPHPGAVATAARILAYTEGSNLLDPSSRTQDPVRVPPQDPYSVRCAPQVLGAAWDAVAFARRTAEIEVNAAVDNPLLFLDLPRNYKAVSCGNFHGAPLGYALDLLKIAFADLASQSERRTFKLTDYRFADGPRAAVSLPAFLVPPAAGLEGLNSGFMIPQYTAASLVSAAKTLAHPDSVDSIPSSANQEDHVSMSMNAGLHAQRSADMCEAVLAIELLAAAQALDLRADQGAPGRGVTAAWHALREEVPHLDHDRVLHLDIERARGLVRQGTLVAAARSAAE